MRKTLSRQEAQEFQQQWEIVNAAEQAELRATPLSQKLQQLTALMASIPALGWSEALGQEEAEVRARWNRLRAARNG